MLRTSVTSPVNTRLLGPDAPTRDKVSLIISEQSASRVRVHLLVPLNPSIAAEESLINHFGGPRLAARYDVDVNLAAERHQHSEYLATLHKSDIGKSLCSEPLTKLSQSDLALGLAPFALQGSSLFHRFFRKISLEGYGDMDAAVQRVILSILSRPQQIVIESPAPLFPWSFLYDDPHFDSSRLRTLKVDRFWGFRHEIQEELEGTTKRIRIPSRPDIVISVCSDVDQPGSTQRSYFPADTCTVRSIETVDELGQSLGAFEADCLYFFGHADQNNPPVAASSTLFLRGIPITVAQLEMRFGAPNFQRIPVFAFLNGCQTSPLGSWDANSMAGFLCKCGSDRCACLATTDRIPVALAAAMAKSLWTEILQNKATVGSALLSARCEILEKWNNPLGLMYTFFGRIDMHLAEDDS
jgi:hypothetical protein